MTPREPDTLRDVRGLTEASESLLRDFDQHPESIDQSELSARLWLIEHAARNVVLARGDAPTPEPEFTTRDLEGGGTITIRTSLLAPTPEPLRDAAQAVVDYITAPEVPTPPFTEAIDRLRAALAATESPDTRALDVESDGDDRHVLSNGVVVFGTREQAERCAVVLAALPPETGEDGNVSGFIPASGDDSESWR